MSNEPSPQTGTCRVHDYIIIEWEQAVRHIGDKGIAKCSHCLKEISIQIVSPPQSQEIKAEVTREKLKKIIFDWIPFTDGRTDKWIDDAADQVLAEFCLSIKGLKEDITNADYLGALDKYDVCKVIDTRFPFAKTSVEQKK